MSTASASTGARRSQLGSIAIIGALFFIFGFVTWLNGPLITFAQLAFELDEVNAFMILTAFSSCRTSSWRFRRPGSSSAPA